MEAVIFDGKEYFKAAVLAERFKYTQDYLGQLCRAKKVDARLVGRAWYINLDSLEGHKQTRYKTPEKAPQLDGESHAPQQNYLSRIDVEPVLKKKTVNIIKNEGGKLTKLAVKYEKDDYSLIPRISREAVSKSLPVLPAEAEDVNVKTTKESVRVTNFKAEPLPEVYLKGILKVDGLPEATEAITAATDEKDSEFANNTIKTELHVLKEVQETDRKVQNDVKKPIKIKLYRQTPPLSKVQTRYPTKVATPVPFAPQSVQQKKLLRTDKEIKVVKVSENSAPPAREQIVKRQEIPHASTKAMSILLFSVLVTTLVLMLGNEVMTSAGSVITSWTFSLDRLTSVHSILVSFLP